LLGGGPVIVVALVPVSRCGVVSNEVAGWGAFDVLTLFLLPRLHGALNPEQPPHIPFTRIKFKILRNLDGEERVGAAMAGMATEKAGMARARAGAAMAMAGVERATVGMMMERAGVVRVTGDG
jgi:hypothetical protein